MKKIEVVGRYLHSISVLVTAPHRHTLVEEQRGLTLIEKRVDLEGDMTTTHTGELAMRTSTDQRENGVVRRERGTNSLTKGQGF